MRVTDLHGGEMKEIFVTFRVSASECRQLDQLARATDRRRSEVLRRLLALASLPEARRLLGEMTPTQETGVKVAG